jgi:hypothetical protein
MTTDALACRQGGDDSVEKKESAESGRKDIA